MGKHGQYRSLVIAAVGAAVLACSAAPAFSACRLALLLGFDASSSVDPGEDRLQRQGIAQALTAPEIRTILLSTPDAPVVLAAYEWSGRYHQTMVLNWTALSSHAAIDNAAAIIATSRRAYSEFPTAVGHSLQFAAKVFETAPRCDFLTLDLSGDGVNNDGFGPRYV